MRRALGATRGRLGATGAGRITHADDDGRRGGSGAGSGHGACAGVARAGGAAAGGGDSGSTPSRWPSRRARPGRRRPSGARHRASGHGPTWLRAQATSTAGRRTGRRALVAAEVALSLVLLTGATLLARSFVALMDVNPGSTRRTCWRAGASSDAQGRGGGLEHYPYPRFARVTQELLERVREMPGVEGAGGVTYAPLTQDALHGYVQARARAHHGIRGGDQRRTRSRLHTTLAGGGPTGDHPVLRDAARAPARRPDVLRRRRPAAGKPRRLRHAAPAGRRGRQPELRGHVPSWREPHRPLSGRRERRRWPAVGPIVGIVGDVHFEALAVPAGPTAYTPYSQEPLDGFVLLARTSGPPSELAAPCAR